MVDGLPAPARATIDPVALADRYEAVLDLYAASGAARPSVPNALRNAEAEDSAAPN